LLPRICPGCRAVPARRWLCRRCAAALAARPPIGPIAPPDGLDRALVLHRYDPLIRRVVLAGKNGARRDLLDELGRSLGDLHRPRVAVGGQGRQPCAGGRGPAASGYRRC